MAVEDRLAAAEHHGHRVAARFAAGADVSADGVRTRLIQKRRTGGALGVGGGHVVRRVGAAPEVLVTRFVV